MSLVLVLVNLLLGGSQNASGQDEEAKLAVYFRQSLDAIFLQRPSQGSELGDRRYDGLFDDVSASARRQWLEVAKATLAMLPKRVDYQRLSRFGQIDYEIFEHDLRQRIWEMETFDPFVTDPRAYGGLISGSVYTLLTQSTAPRETNVANVIARINQTPAVIAAARRNLDRPPRVLVETAIQQNRGAIAFYEKEIVALAGETTQAGALRDAAAQLVPVMKDYQTFLEKEVLPRADGEWRIGLDKFRRKFEYVTGGGATADQIYADAQIEFQRVRMELYVVARQVWNGYFPGKPLPPDDEEGRRLTVEWVLKKVGEDHGPAERLVQDVREGVERVKRFISAAGILRLPDPDLCRVIEMPEFQRGNSTAYMNSPPPLDKNATGYYAVSPPPKHWDAARVKSYLEEYNRHMLDILTIHEAYPGHYVQFEYANRNPSLIRKVLGSGVYIEGWAVYTEQTMLDQGFGGGNLALRLSQLKFYLRAVANALLDRQMHCENLSDEAAMDLLVRQAFQSEGEARLKVIRAKQSSVQLSTYFTGRMAHYRLRQQMQRELGDSFVLGRFHEAVLEPGAVPVKYLPELVRERLRRP